MADKINEIISPEAFAQLEKLTADLNESAAAMKQLAEYARGLDFSKAKSLSDLGQWAQDYEKNLNAMSAANQNYANNLQKAIVLKQQLNGSTKSVVDTYDKLEAAELKAAKAAEIRERTAQKAAAETEKAAKREEKALRELNNEYELLKRAYKDAADKAKELGVSFGTNSKIFKDAASNAKVMYDRLLKVEMAVGQGQRAVGQYSLAAEGLKQTLREMPAFANSFQTGLMAVSNNLPTLIDGIKQLNQKNKEIVASGGEAVGVWDTMKEELKDFGTIAVIATTVLTVVVNKWDDIMSFINNVTKKTVDVKQELTDITNANINSISAEMSGLKSLASIAADNQQSMKLRLEAVKKLQDQYPDYLGNLSKEKILSGDIADSMERLNQALINKAIMEAYNQKVGQQASIFANLQDELEKYENKLKQADRTFRELNTGSTNQYAVNAKVRAAQDAENAKREIENIKKRSKEVEKEMNRLQAQADKFASMAAGLVTGGGDKTKKPKTKKESKDTTLKSESDLLQSIYDNKQKELEITRDTNKAIADDTTKEMADRLVAHENYLSAVLELARNERDRTIDLEGEKLDEIDRLKQKAKGKELANLIEQQRAAMIRVNTAQMEFNGKQKEVVEKGQKEVIDIVASSNNEWAKDEEKKNEKLKEMQLQAYLVEEELLRRALEGKEITRKEYNTRLKDLQKKQNIAFLQNEVELYDKLLANEQLADDKREEYRKKRNAAQKSLFNAQQGVQTKRSGRITDPIAMMLGIGDEEALKAFYDKTIDLVNRATDAIIAAKQRQYQAELTNLDKQKEGIQSNYDMQLALINATGKSEQDKANKISQLNAQKLTQEAIIEQKKREVAQKQAQFEKTAAIASIIQNTAVAIAGALKYGPAAPPIIALIAASGAAQLAAASNAPIPAYKEGTDNHIGGAFIAGDGGEPELIVAPNKRPYWSNNVSTLYNEGAGTKVIPMSDIMQYTTTNTEDFSAAQLDALANRIAKSFDKTGYKIAQVIQSSKPQDNSRAIGEAMRNQFNLQGK